MRKITGYLITYWQTVSKASLLAAAAFTAVLVFINYRYNLNDAIYALPTPLTFLGWYSLFLLAFGVGHLLQPQGTKSFHQQAFVLLLLAAPAVFAWKMTAEVDFQFTANVIANRYWNAVVYWPYKVAVIVSMLFLLHHFFNRHEGFYGATFKGFNARPYLLMLTLMVPLIVAASFLPDFQRMYPRMQSVEYLHGPGHGLEKLLYQFCYGLDFFAIELFFRGFLVLAFVKWVGKDAVLPMAMFYCTIHFGKPLGECVSSFFGGLILGIVTYHTRTIMGGFFVHVGIAWLMELGGYLHPHP